MIRRTPIKIMTRAVAVAALGLSLAACTATFQNHGYIPPQEDLDLLAVGIDTRASVEDSVGSPSSGGVLEGGGYYYVKSRVKTFGFKAPEVVEREVLAITFDANGVIANIERFGLEDGRCRAIVAPRHQRRRGPTKPSCANFLATSAASTQVSKSCARV